MQATALHSWPAESLAEAIGLLARRSGVAQTTSSSHGALPPSDAVDWSAHIDALANPMVASIQLACEQPHRPSR